MFAIRRAIKKDIPTLCRYRYMMFEDIGKFENLDSKKEELMKLTTFHFENNINNKDHYSIIASVDNNNIGCGTMIISERPPHPKTMKSKVGYILNIYISKEYRKRGYASQIMNHFHKYAKANHIYKLEMNASVQGKSIYEKIGYSLSDTFMEYKS